MSSLLSNCCRRRIRISELTREQKLRAASDGCMVAGGASLVVSVLTWAAAKARSSKEDQASGERLGIFIGLWVPSLLLAAAFLTRKADDAAFAEREEEPFLEELM